MTAMSEGWAMGALSKSVCRCSLPFNAVDDDPLPDLKELPARRVLVVDDNHDATETLGALLHLSALGAAVRYRA